MTNVDRVDERVAEQAADQADDAVGAEHAGRREGIAGGRGALDIVHRLDEIIDAEGNGRDQNDPEVPEPVKHMPDRRDRERKAEMRERVANLGAAQAAVAKPEQVRSPGDDRAGHDGDETAGHAAVIAHPAEPVGQDDREADHADQRRLEDLQAGPHRDEGDRDAGERAEQRGARRDPANDGGDEAAGHQHEALDEHPGQSRLPGLNGIVGLGQDGQHDHKGDDEHVRHADA